MLTDNPRHRLIYARHRLPLAKAELEGLMEQRADESAIATQERIYIAVRIAVLRAELSELRPIVAEARAVS